MSEKLMSEYIHLVATVDPFDGAGTTVKSDVWDMQKYRNVMAVVSTGTIQAGGTVDAHLEESATSNGTFTTLTGKSITQMTTTMAASQAIMNLSQAEVAATTAAGARWCRLNIDGAGATVAYSGHVFAVHSRFKEPWTTISYGDLATVIEIVA
jgi:hypothetical protein